MWERSRGDKVLSGPPNVENGHNAEENQVSKVSSSLIIVFPSCFGSFLLTISQYKKSLENMTIGLCGDLKFGRTVHSLVKTLSKFSYIEKL